MPVNLSAPDPAALHAVAGVQLGVTMAGMRKAGKRDLVVMVLDAGSSVAGVFTRNRFCAAPVQVCREHLASGRRSEAAFAPCSSTPAMPTRAPVPMAWHARAAAAPRWPAVWGSRPSRCCRFPPA